MTAAKKPDRVKVTDPYTGVEITVNADSPQAKTWGTKPKRAAKKAEPKSDEQSDK